MHLEIEVEELQEMFFLEGNIWIGDPIEIFSKEEWENIQYQCTNINSLNGWILSFSGGVECCLIDIITVDDTIIAIEKENEIIDDVETNSSYLLIIHENDLEKYIKNKKLTTGNFLYVPQSCDVTVKGTYFRLDDYWKIHR